MRILVLGCSTAFPGLKTFNQSFLLEENGQRLLVDCGEDTPKALIKHKIDVKTIGGVYISHLHADHCFGIPRLGLARYDWTTMPRHFSQGNYAPKLYAKQLVLTNLWDAVRHPLETLQNIKGTLETFFEPMPVGDHFMWEGWKIRLIQQVHVVSDAEIMPSFGLILTQEGHQSMYLTTDSQYCSPHQIEDFYRIVDIIIQDTELNGCDMRWPEGTRVYQEKGKWKLWPTVETDPDGMHALDLCAQGFEPQEWACSKFYSGVHANYAQLAGYPSANSTRLDKETKAKMWLSHYQDFKLAGKDAYGHRLDWDAQAQADGFCGFVKTGQVFEI